MSKKEKQPTTEKVKRPVDQLKMAKIISKEMPHLSLSDIQAVIQREQELTILAIAEGRKVVKKNYLTLYPIDVKAKKWKSPLNGQEYELPEHKSIGVRLGEGFKARVAEKSMPRKLCRTVQKETDA